MLFSVLVLNLLFVITPTFSARILGIIPSPFYSHQIVFRPLWKELSLRGHQVTVLTTDPMRNSSLTNLTEIDLHFTYAMFESRMNLNELSKLSAGEFINHYFKLSYDLVEQQLLYPAVQVLLQNKSQGFDVVLIESIYPAMVAFAEKYNCPSIQILSLEIGGCHYHSIGNPSHPILNPEFLATYTENPGFLKRLTYVFYYFFLNFLFPPYFYESQQPLVKKYFGENYPPLDDMLSRTSMMFINTDVIFHPIRSLLPNVIQIGGGMHFTPPKPLPKDLQKLLDNATNGFIYFSLGSNVRSELLPKDTSKVLLEVFAELPYTILWKFEQENLPGKPDNVIISKWFPQQDILRHPNIKLFITQGGLQSREEAVHNHVPMIGIPFILEQVNNVQRMVEKGMGLKLDYETLDKQTFKETILEVINNPKYRDRVKELDGLAKDQPMTGLERAVWWTEYVIRHKGAKHLRSPALDLPSYQYFLLDVIGFCLLVILIITYVLFRLVRFIFNLKKYFKPRDKVKVQ